MDKTEQAYRSAEGCCLSAMLALRRFDSKEAVDELKRAIRLIEDEQRGAQREDRLRFSVAAPVAPLF